MKVIGGINPSMVKNATGILLKYNKYTRQCSHLYICTGGSVILGVGHNCVRVHGPVDCEIEELSYYLCRALECDGVPRRLLLRHIRLRIARKRDTSVARLVVCCCGLLGGWQSLRNFHAAGVTWSACSPAISPSLW